MRRPLNLTLPFVRRNFRSTHIITETELVCCVRGEATRPAYSILAILDSVHRLSYDVSGTILLPYLAECSILQAKDTVRFKTSKIKNEPWECVVMGTQIYYITRNVSYLLLNYVSSQGSIWYLFRWTRVPHFWGTKEVLWSLYSLHIPSFGSLWATSAHVTLAQPISLVENHFTRQYNPEDSSEHLLWDPF
jgi:hypothetical protein